MTVTWTNTEVDLIVLDYFSILAEELVGNAVNKTEHRKQIKPLLNNRSDGAIEFKHQNISAVLIKLGLPFIKGYKPMGNYQQALEDTVIKTIFKERHFLEPKLNYFVDNVVSIDQHLDFKNILETAPEPQTLSLEKETIYERTPFKINYLALEQSNSSVGQVGELIVLKYEKWRLNAAGKLSLADRIEWISKDDDGAGFDILSKNTNGTDLYIEVKSTKLTKETPIFFSKNEYHFSIRNRNNYCMYRVFNLDKRPKLFYLNGSFDDFCRKEAVQYKGMF